jgi:hypothetical protein
MSFRTTKFMATSKRAIEAVPLSALLAALAAAWCLGKEETARPAMWPLRIPLPALGGMAAGLRAISSRGYRPSKDGNNHHLNKCPQGLRSNWTRRNIRAQSARVK